MAHSPQALRELGRIVAGSKALGRAGVRERYGPLFMRALARAATTRRQVNVLHHALGFLRERLDAGARADVLRVIEDYGAGLVPVVVPLTLIRHYAHLLAVPYLTCQLYLAPHPKELMLRNHV